MRPPQPRIPKLAKLPLKAASAPAAKPQGQSPPPPRARRYRGDYPHCCPLHCVEHAGDELLRNLFVKEIAHGVDKYHSGRSPAQGLIETPRTECQVKTRFERVAGRAAEALSEALGIAMVASSAYLGAASHRVPGRIRPFNRCGVAHDPS